MIWGGISAFGRTELAFIDSTMDSNMYVQVLEDYLLPYSLCVHDDRYTFMQDNAGVHRAHVVRDWFQHINVPVLPWPSLSPDLNPIENVWGALARMVYGNGRQFYSVAELKKAILENWNLLSDSVVKHNIESMQRRCEAIIKASGEKIQY